MPDIRPLLDAALLPNFSGSKVRDFGINGRPAPLRMEFGLLRRNDAGDHSKSTSATAVIGTPVGYAILVGEALERSKVEVDLLFVVEFQSSEALFTAIVLLFSLSRNLFLAISRTVFSFSGRDGIDYDFG